MKKLAISLVTLLLLAGCSQSEKAKPAENVTSPTVVLELSAESASSGTLSIWSTQYLVHVAQAVPAADGIAIANSQGQSFGVHLTRRDWCDAAMEGTTTVHSTDGSVRTFNYATRGAQEWTNCDDFFPKVKPSTKLGLRRSTYVETTSYAPDGLGTAGFRLVPFRTVAVDPKFIPIGTVLFIPKLKGVTVKDEGGQPWVHDGYVFAADVGGEIKGNHIDFFTGRSKTNPAPEIITSSPRRPFEAKIVTEPQTIAELRRLHQINR